MTQKLPLYHWQPSIIRHRFRHNFGDTLMAVIAERIMGSHICRASRFTHSPRLLAGGSILHQARPQDILWGVGLRHENFQLAPTLDIRAVRGPVTRDFIVKNGQPCPEIYGDPACLVPQLFPEWQRAPVKGRIGLVPHYRMRNHYKNLPPDVMLISSVRHPQLVIRDILTCECIIAGSLHGIIVAESYGIPARWLPGDGVEPTIKYTDYYASTGRAADPASSLSRALENGGQAAGSGINLPALLGCFPLLPATSAVL